MAEAVIFPARPLFMVDRSWQRHKKRAKQKPELRLAGIQPSSVPEVSIILAKSRTDAEAASVYEEGKRSAPRRNQNEFSSLRFVEYDPSNAGNSLRQVREKKTAVNRDKKGKTRGKICRATPASNGHKPTGTTRSSPVLASHVPGTASPLYSVIDPEARPFQGFASYYFDRMATTIFPISKYVPLQSNPIQTVWLPAAVTDQALLHTILYSSALHYSAASKLRKVKDGEVLMKVILDRLSHRLSTGTLSDVTIGAVSCLALCENSLGNHDKWAMHTAGMSEMIRVRGGVSSIPEKMRMKIYRADIIGAVDTLSWPRLPRPFRTSPSLYRVMGLKMEPNEGLASMLAEIRPSRRVFTAFIDLSVLCQVLEQAAKEQMPLDTRAYDEDVICIQHDLLVSDPLAESGAEKLCRLAGLIFVQTLTREKPFLKASSTLLSQELRESLISIGSEAIPETLLFWISFMGGLVSAATDDRDWYLQRLVGYRKSNGETVSWTDAKLELGKVMWIERVQEDYGKDLWHQLFE